MAKPYWSIWFGSVVVQSELGDELIKGEPVAQLGSAVLVGVHAGLPERLLAWPVLEPSHRYDPLVATRVDVIAVQGKASQVVLLPVDVHGGLCEGHRVAGDDTHADVPALRDVRENPCSDRQLPN